MAQWHIAPSLLALRDQYDAIFPARSRASDGFLGDASHAARPSDHNPDYGAPGARKGVVRAGDYCTEKISVAQHLKIVADLIATEKRNPVARIWYIIHWLPGDPYPRIWSRTTKWKPKRYTGASPHNHHFHVSLMRTAAAERDTSPWFTELAPRPAAATIEGGALPSVKEIFSTDDVLPNDGITPNRANKAVSFGTFCLRLWALVRGQADELARLAVAAERQADQLAQITQRLDQLSKR